jgi:intracellular septation protein A
MFVLGMINIYVAASFSIETWAWWMSVGATGAKACVFVLHYAIFRTLIRRNLRLALTSARPETV